MKTTAIVILLMLISGLYNPCQSQMLILSTDKGKTCTLAVEVGKMKDNLVDIIITPTWVSEALRPVADLQSVIGFTKEKIAINTAYYIRLVDPSEGSLIASNSRIKLTYEVLERFPGGEFVFKFPFFYASGMEAAQTPSSREEFTFKRPRDYSLAFNIQRADIIDKYPPAITILSPEGADEGFKRITDSLMIRVKFLATDAFGMSNVTVNNIPAERIDDTTYYAHIALREGYENPIVVTALDLKGKTSRKQFAVESRKQEAKTFVAVAAPPVPEPPKKVLSDVDIDVPVAALPNPNKFALIIGNEDYSNFQSGLQAESDVEFAIRDAEVFREYAIKILGVPEENIIFKKNATVMEMNRALSQVTSVIKASKGKAELYAFYAGHGFPDEQTREPYLIPVDVSGSDLAYGIKLNDFYKRITEFPSKRVTVFLDACFSGGGRSQGLIAARGVKVKPRETVLKGNIVVFTASSGEQSSLPYRDKQHGIFTYYLLKKLKETQGDISMKDLSDFLSVEIGIRSVIVNNKEQNPQTNVNPLLGESWKNWMIR